MPADWGGLVREIANMQQGGPAQPIGTGVLWSLWHGGSPKMHTASGLSVHSCPLCSASRRSRRSLPTRAPAGGSSATHPLVLPCKAAGGVESRDGRAANGEERIEYRSHGASVAQLTPTRRLRVGGCPWDGHGGESAIRGGSRAGKEGKHGVIPGTQRRRVTGECLFAFGCSGPFGQGGEEVVWDDFDRQRRCVSRVAAGVVGKWGGGEDAVQFCGKGFGQEGHERAESIREMILERHRQGRRTVDS